MVLDRNNMDITKRLQDNFETIRLQRRLRLYEVAELSGLSMSFIQKFKAGHRGITVDNAAKLASAFDMTLVGLINWRGHEH